MKTTKDCAEQTCGCEYFKDHKLTPCSKPGVWYHPRYPNASFCEEHKQITERVFPLYWSKEQLPMKLPLDFTNTDYDLTGPKGNAFVIMGTVCSILKEFKLLEEASEYLIKAKHSNYKNLILVTDQYVRFNWIFPEGAEWEEFEAKLLQAREQP